MAKKKRGPITDPIVFAKLVLRRGSIRWYARYQALVNQRTDRGVYRCAMCGELFKKEDLQADHIEPVESLKGNDNDLNEFITRLFTPVENWQWICSYKLPDGTKAGCHQIKSAEEATMRAFYRQQKKKK